MRVLLFYHILVRLSFALLLHFEMKTNTYLLIWLVLMGVCTSAYGQQRRTVVCKEVEFKQFPERVHVKCDQAYNGIRYFGVATENTEMLDTLNALRQERKKSEVLRISFDSEDLSGSRIGCLVHDCRLIARVRLSPAPYVDTFTVDGLSRRALIIPAVQSPGDAPLVIYFHGRGGDIHDSTVRRRFDQLWPEATIVYAEGTRVNTAGLPYQGHQLAWTLRFPYKYQLGQERDIKYVRTLLRRISNRHTINNNRVYASGHSSGGFFTFSLMEILPESFAAFAVVGSYARFRVEKANAERLLQNRARPVNLSPGDHARLPRPVFYAFGKGDTVFDRDAPDRLNGWSASPELETRSRSTLTQLLIRNRCPLPGKGLTHPVELMSFSCVPHGEGAPVKWKLHNGSHSWPEEANEWVIDFFKSH